MDELDPEALGKAMAQSRAASLARIFGVEGMLVGIRIGYELARVAAAEKATV